MKINIFNVERDHEGIKDELVGIFNKVLTEGEYILGDRLTRFEDAFAEYIGVKHAVGVANGTDAIRLGGLALGLKPGDKVVTTPNTYVATTMALSTQGIMPVFTDIEKENYNMDPKALDETLAAHKDVKVCIPVHLYGHAARMDEILDVCAAHGVYVLEDACQAHGALYGDEKKKVGSLGNAAAFSFYPTKNLGCYGDAGMVVTDSDETYEEVLKLRNFGQGKDKHVHLSDGFNSRLDSLQAEILTFKLGLLNAWNEKRRGLARLYTEALAGLPVTLPTEASWTRHVFHLYVIRSGQRKALMDYLVEKEIGTLIHYPTPIHLQPAYRHLGYGTGSFPKAEQAAREIISLPMYPSLREDEVFRVCDAIRSFYRK